MLCDSTIPGSQPQPKRGNWGVNRLNASAAVRSGISGAGSPPPTALATRSRPILVPTVEVLVALALATTFPTVAHWLN